MEKPARGGEKKNGKGEEAKSEKRKQMEAHACCVSDSPGKVDKERVKPSLAEDDNDEKKWRLGSKRKGKLSQRREQKIVR